MEGRSDSSSTARLRLLHVLSGVEGSREHRRSSPPQLFCRTAETVAVSLQGGSIAQLDSLERLLIHHAVRAGKGVVAGSPGQGPCSAVLVSSTEEG